MVSIFTDKSIVPTESDIENALAEMYDYWQQIVALANNRYPENTKEWFISVAKYGWAFRIKDKKRALLYLLPREGFFKISFVFGQKATNEVLESTVSEIIKDKLKSAKAYREGRGLMIEIKDGSLLNDIKILIDIKLKN